MKRIVALLVLAAGTLFPMPSSAGAPMCFGREATITEPNEHGVFKGTSRDDVIVGTRDTDFISGAGGNDRICGRGQNDYLAGDFDWCRGEPGRDLIAGQGGADTLIGDSCWQGQGGGRADVLRGGPDPDVLAGGPGDDRMDGEGSDRDLIFLSAVGSVRVDLSRGTVRGEGSDRVASVEGVYSRECRHAGDVIVGNGKDNRLYGSEGPGLIEARRGRDKVLGDGVPDDPNSITAGGECHSGSGDRIYAGGGADLVRSAKGDDHVFGGGGRDEADGGSGTDHCVAIERKRSCEI